MEVEVVAVFLVVVFGSDMSRAVDLQALRGSTALRSNGMPNIFFPILVCIVAVHHSTHHLPYARHAVSCFGQGWMTMIVTESGAS